jgi:hypothetical protein
MARRNTRKITNALQVFKKYDTWRVRDVHREANVDSFDVKRDAVDFAKRHAKKEDYHGVIVLTEDWDVSRIWTNQDYVHSPDAWYIQE